jgi:endonuclease YncB( thermonuclease family)
MKDFFEKNKIPIAIIIAGLVIAGSIWLSNRSATIRPKSPSEGKLTPQQRPKAAEQIQQPAIRISYTEAPEHVGEYACVKGRVDHVYTSRKGTIFINFCPDYKTCPFGAVIFGSDAHKFTRPNQYGGKTVEITGLIETYQGRAEIVLKDPGQIKILPFESSLIKDIKESPALYRVVSVIDGDTIRVDINGTTETVRLIGIDTPEIANPNNLQGDYFGPEAAQYAKQLLENKSVYLIPDPMQSNRDKYNRLLRYVFLEDGILINAKLIEEGFAYNYMYEPFQFMKQFDYLEKQAKENQLGLWSAKKPEN